MSSENVTLIVAFGGGIISILSPCVLPMVPGYIALVTGLEISDVREGRA
ncbi:MAG: cytochrome c biogenesis protein CcdA, partial [Acidimicrobiia bacterium]|nr:cytochrome c biogenesis protein CcdA [Acidimicrobiia bacterium]